MAAASWIKRGALGAFGAAVLWFAVEGGEYGTHDLWQQRARTRRVVDSVAALTHVVDSLERYKRLVQADPVTQERIAREEFGMVKGGKELLYKFAPRAGDSTGSSGRARATPAGARPATP